jgi:hypothetical protein
MEIILELFRKAMVQYGLDGRAYEWDSYQGRVVVYDLNGGAPKAIASVY